MMSTGSFLRQRLSGSVALAALLLLPTVSLAADEPNPIVTQVKAALKDPAKPFTLLVFLQVKDGMQEKFEAAFTKAIKGTRRRRARSPTTSIATQRCRRATWSTSAGRVSRTWKRTCKRRTSPVCSAT